MSKRNNNQFGAIIAAHQHEADTQDSTATTDKKERTSKRGNPDYSPVTVYIPTETYARAQFEMALQGRKREMSGLFTELLTEWLQRQQ